MVSGFKGVSLTGMLTFLSKAKAGHQSMPQVPRHAVTRCRKLFPKYGCRYAAR
jgi:hypothetical protein